MMSEVWSTRSFWVSSVPSSAVAVEASVPSASFSVGMVVPYKVVDHSDAEPVAAWTASSSVVAASPTWLTVATVRSLAPESASKVAWAAWVRSSAVAAASSMPLRTSLSSGS